MKKQNGITLIALVITIIVLLILAGVSISAVMGENGIATKAKESAKKTEEAKKEEEEDLDEVEDYLNDASPELNEYGFYFDQLYVVTITENEEEIELAIIFHEDGAYETFVNAPDFVPGYLMFKEAFPAGNINYEEFVENGIISNNGETLKMGEGSLNVAFERTHGIYLGKKYECSYIEETGEETIMTVVFNEDGTAKLTGKIMADGDVVNTRETEHTDLTYDANGYAVLNIDGDLMAQVSPDGTAIYMNGIEGIFVKK